MPTLYDMDTNEYGCRGSDEDENQTEAEMIDHGKNGDLFWKMKLETDDYMARSRAVEKSRRVSNLKKQVRIQEHEDMAEVRRCIKENKTILQKKSDPGNWASVEAAIEKAEIETAANPVVDLQEWTEVVGKKSKRSRNQRKHEAVNQVKKEDQSKKPEVWSLTVENDKVGEALKSIETIWPIYD